jgi:hypothetical protein
VNDADLLRLLSIDAADLDTAPPWPPYRGLDTARIDGSHRCAQCGEPAQATTIVDVPGVGRRWLDTCRAHGLAADLRAAARAAGVGLTIVTDDVVSR